MFFCSKKESKLTVNELAESFTPYIVGDLVLLGKKDEDEVAETLTNAFIDDPSFNWLVNLDDVDIEKKKNTVYKSNKWFMRMMNQHLLDKRSGIMLGVPGNSESNPNQLAGALAVVPGGTNSITLFDFIKYSIKNRKTFPKNDCGPKFLERMEKSSSIYEKKKRKYIKGRFIYLQQVGVLAEFQGRGVGGKMLKPLLKTADDLNASIYLETMSKENESLYIHYGFKTVEKFDLFVQGDESTDAKLTNYIMIRAPFS